jgi:thiol-disulfide isomerase/thioredoxin
MRAPRSAIASFIALHIAPAFFVAVASFVSLAPIALAQARDPAATPPAADTRESPPKPLDSKVPTTTPDSPPSTKKSADPDLALKRAVAEAQNDRAALVRNLEQYLVQFPDAPRKAAVYRALVESCEQLNDDACALDNAERLVAIHPDDSEMMMVAVNLLEHRGDDQSLTRASGYLTRVLDRVEKTPSDQKSARVSQADWQSQQAQLRASLYVLRGKIEETQRDYDQAIKDFDASNRLRPNAIAEQHLGTIAELQDNPKAAAEHYLNAFVLPENGPGGAVDRVVVRKNLSNIWKEIHGSDAGLGEATLRAFDRQQAIPHAQSPRDKNRDLKDPFSFTLRQIDGAPFPLAPLRGKVLILSFWATWCGPCRELEPIFAQVAGNYEGRTDAVFFAVNVDEDDARAKPFLDEQKWTVKPLFADGLDDLLKVIALPTVVILDRNGKIAYRANGYQPEGFEERLTNAVEKALHSEH